MRKDSRPSLKYYKLELNLPEAKYFSDLGGVRLELNTILSLCTQADGLPESSKREAEIIDALGIACIMKYIRCFHHTGKRQSLSLNDIQTLSVGLRETHKTIKHLRDKHIAHSVSHLEECYCEVQIEEENGIRKAVERITTGIEIVIINKEQLRDIQQLVSEVLVIVERKLRTEEIRLIGLVNGLPAAEIDLLRRHKDLEVDFSNIGVARK